MVEVKMSITYIYLFTYLFIYIYSFGSFDEFVLNELSRTVVSNWLNAPSDFNPHACRWLRIRVEERRGRVPVIERNERAAVNVFSIVFRTRARRGGAQSPLAENDRAAGFACRARQPTPPPP